MRRRSSWKVKIKDFSSATALKQVNNSRQITLALRLVWMEQPAPPVRKRRMLITRSERVNFRDALSICTNVGRQKVEGPFGESELQTHLQIFLTEMWSENWNQRVEPRFKSSDTNGESCSSHQRSASVVSQFRHSRNHLLQILSLSFPQCLFNNGEMQSPNNVVRFFGY